MVGFLVNIRLKRQVIMVSFLKKKANFPKTSLGHDLYDYGEMTALYYMQDIKDVYNVPLNRASRFGRRWNDGHAGALSLMPYGKMRAASFDVMERLTHRYTKPVFGIERAVSSSGHVYDVTPVPVMEKPFCTLLNFMRNPIGSGIGPNKNHDCLRHNVLIVAPYSGHHATLLRDMAGAFVKDHNVYITDWANGRDVPIGAGNFTLEDYIQYLIDFIRFFNGDVHIIAVCQPAVPLLAATALLADHQDPAAPHSITLMGGPIDTRVNPTAVNLAAKTKSYEWFEQSIIARVPVYYPGALRRVCPGFLLLSGFMSLNMDRHITAGKSLFNHLMQSDVENVHAHKAFYDEYRSVLDLPADYYLDSVRVCFQNHDLPKGQLIFKGDVVKPAAISKTWLLTVEGEKDDISGIGQTKAAHDLCTGLKESQKWHHMQEGVGHYGVFNGRRFRENIAPIMYDFIEKSATGKNGAKPGSVPSLTLHQGAKHHHQKSQNHKETL